MAGWVNLPVHSPRIFACTYIPSLRVPKQKPSLPSFHRVVRKARGASKPRPRRPPRLAVEKLCPGRGAAPWLRWMGASHALRTRAAEASPMYAQRTHTAAKGNGWREDDLPRATASAEQPSQPSSTTGMCMYMEVHGKPRDDDLQMMMWTCVQRCGPSDEDACIHRCIPTTDIHTHT